MNNNGLSAVRDAVIRLMERVPELDKLEGEAWFVAEDRIVDTINEIIEENNKK